MNRDEWNKTWSGEHARHQGPSDHVHDGGVHHFDGTPDTLLVHTVEGLPPGNALDLGCGSGDNVLWLAERGWAATGVDFASAALKLARQEADKRGLNAVFVEADATGYRPTEKLDLITLFYLHLSEDSLPQVLNRAVDWLAPDGMLLFAGHDRSDPKWHEHIPPERLSTPEAVTACLNGLDIDRAEVVMHDAHRHGAAGTTLVVARKPT